MFTAIKKFFVVSCSLLKDVERLQLENANLKFSLERISKQSKEPVIKQAALNAVKGIPYLT